MGGTAQPARPHRNVRNMDIPPVSTVRRVVFPAVPPAALVVAQYSVPAEAPRFPPAPTGALVSINVSAGLSSVVRSDYLHPVPYLPSIEYLSRPARLRNWRAGISNWISVLLMWWPQRILRHVCPERLV